MSATEAYCHSTDNPKASIFIQQPILEDIKLGISLTANQVTEQIQAIGYQATLGSNWIDELADEHGLSADEMARRAYDPADDCQYIDRLQLVEDSMRQGTREHMSYWFGEFVKKWPTGGYSDELDEFYPDGQPQGFVSIERLDPSHGHSGSVEQLATGAGRQVVIKELYVKSSQQQKGLATALAYAALDSQNPLLRSSLETPVSNRPMRAWAEKYGHELVGFYTDRSHFRGLPVEFAHYEASSVGLVRENMVKLNPWLNEYHITREAISLQEETLGQVIPIRRQG